MADLEVYRTLELLDIMQTKIKSSKKMKIKKKTKRETHSLSLEDSSSILCPIM